MKRIQVGTGSARIVSITAQRVDYIDELGQDGFIDLDECARVWNREHGAPPPTVGGKHLRFVGWRGSLYSNPTWLQFYDQRQTRFEFQTGEAMVGDILEGLHKGDCRLNDAT